MMELKISTNQMLKILTVISWIIFIGICIEAGSFIFNVFFTLFINPDNAGYLDLSDLHKYDAGHYSAEMLIIIIVAVMRAILFYLIVKILHEKKVNISQPFNKEMGSFMFKVSYLALGIGLFSYWGANYTAWLVSKGVTMPAMEKLHLGGADVWIFMGVTLLVVAQIFKRGIEIQSENDLTI
jgi:hypothetical protein